MSIPGQNILGMALSVIAKQSMTYYPYASRTIAANGTLVATYGTSVTVSGSFQPVPRTLYQNLGLLFQKNYAYIFIQRSIIDIARDVAGDQFGFNGKKWQAESKTPWSALDGWDQVLCVEVP